MSLNTWLYFKAFPQSRVPCLVSARSNGPGVKARMVHQFDRGTQGRNTATPPYRGAVAGHVATLLAHAEVWEWRKSCWCCASVALVACRRFPGFRVLALSQPRVALSSATGRNIEIVALTLRLLHPGDFVDFVILPPRARSSRCACR